MRSRGFYPETARIYFIMAQRNNQANAIAWLAVLHRLLREVRRLNRAFARGEERTDSLVHFLIGLIQDMDGEGAGVLDSAPLRPARRRGPKDGSFLLEIAAQRGVEKLEMLPQTEGAAAVRIDGGKTFHLSPNLAVLLEALAQDTGRDDGELVGWKSFADVQRQLQVRMGRPFSKHTVEQLLSRLRKALQFDGEVNPRFIRTHPRFGLRFALRKRPRA